MYNEIRKCSEFRLSNSVRTFESKVLIRTNEKHEFDHETVFVFWLKK